jgi:hypothetical protein
MSLGNAPDYPSVEDISTTQKEQKTNQLQSFDDFKQYNNTENQQILKEIQENAL